MNIAYIDMQNVHQSTKEMGRIIDRTLLYSYLQNKYSIRQVFVFIGFIQKYQHIYQQLQSIGFTLIFKEVVVRNDGSIKGDVDIDIAIYAMHHMYNHVVSEAYLITGDADYNSLINERQKHGLFGKLLVPNQNKTLYILRKAAGGKLQSLQEIRHIIEKKQKD